MHGLASLFIVGFVVRCEKLRLPRSIRIKVLMVGALVVVLDVIAKENIERIVLTSIAAMEDVFAV